MGVGPARTAASGIVPSTPSTMAKATRPLPSCTARVSVNCTAAYMTMCVGRAYTFAGLDRGHCCRLMMQDGKRWQAHHAGRQESKLYVSSVPADSQFHQV